VNNILKRNRNRNILLCGFCTLVVLACSASASSTSSGMRDTATSATSSYSQQANYGIQTLQRWYLESSGLYEKPTDWWNSANAVTVLVDYSERPIPQPICRCSRNNSSDASRGLDLFQVDPNRLHDSDLRKKIVALTRSVQPLSLPRNTRSLITVIERAKELQQQTMATLLAERKQIDAHLIQLWHG